MGQFLKEYSNQLPVQKCIAGEDVENLSDYELLAIILGTGTRSRDVIEIAAEILKIHGGIPGIFCTGIRELAMHHGIGLKKSIKIHAALEIGKRIISNIQPALIIDSPKKVWEILLPEIIGKRQEEFRVIILNNKNRLIKKKVVSMGTISEAIVHPREIFRDAIRESASSIIIAHNHPSGVVTPSREDISTTERIMKVGKIIGIELLDHVIVCESSYLSMKEGGYL